MTTLRDALIANIEANQRLLECVNGEHDGSASEVTDAVNAALELGRVALALDQPPTVPVPEEPKA